MYLITTSILLQEDDDEEDFPIGITAKEGLKYANAEAEEWREDAELISAGDTGRGGRGYSTSWIYWYRASGLKNSDVLEVHVYETFKVEAYEILNVSYMNWRSPIESTKRLIDSNEVYTIVTSKGGRVHDLYLEYNIRRSIPVWQATTDYDQDGPRNEKWTIDARTGEILEHEILVP